jgi:cytochrome c553
MKLATQHRNLAVLAALFCVVLRSGAQTPDPRPDVAKGKQIASQVCAACHAEDGNSTIPGNPRLAQQHSDYLHKQLLDFTVRKGQQKPLRENAVMSTFAAQLSDADKRNVAAWFASQAAKPASARDQDLLALGQRIYRAGVPEKALPACFGCHNPAGVGTPSLYPRLSGQHAEYVDATLKAFRDGTRRNNLAMQQIAAKMSDAEMRAVAEYIQGLRK